MKQTLMRNAAPASKAKPVPEAQTAPTAAPAAPAASAARHWALPDPGVFASQKPVAVPRTKPEALDISMVAKLAKIASAPK